MCQLILRPNDWLLSKQVTNGDSASTGVFSKQKHQQAFLSPIVLNIFHQCILPGINAKSSYDHLIKSQYTKEISSLVLLVSQQKNL